MRRNGSIPPPRPTPALRPVRRFAGRGLAIPGRRRHHQSGRPLAIKRPSPRLDRPDPGFLYQGVADTLRVVGGAGDAYLSAEDRARVKIDRLLTEAGWAVQRADRVNLGAGRGVAIREFILQRPHGRPDYLLY